MTDVERWLPPSGTWRWESAKHAPHVERDYEFADWLLDPSNNVVGLVECFRSDPDRLFANVVDRNGNHHRRAHSTAPLGELKCWVEEKAGMRAPRPDSGANPV